MIDEQTLGALTKLVADFCCYAAYYTELGDCTGRAPAYKFAAEWLQAILDGESEISTVAESKQSQTIPDSLTEETMTNRIILLEWGSYAVHQTLSTGNSGAYRITQAWGDVDEHTIYLFLHELKHIVETIERHMEASNE